MAGRRPSQRTPRWTAAIHRKPSSPAVLGTTRLRSWGPRTVQGVPGLSSLQGVSRGGFPRLFQLLGAPGIRPWAGGHPAPVSASIRKRLYPTYVPVYKQLRTAAPWAVGTTLSKLGSVLPSSLPLRESPGSTRGQALRFQVDVRGLGGRRGDGRQGGRREDPAHNIRLWSASWVRPPHTAPPKGWGRQTAAHGDAVLNTTSWGTPGFGSHLLAAEMCCPGSIRRRDQQAGLEPRGCDRHTDG